MGEIPCFLFILFSPLEQSKRQFSLWGRPCQEWQLPPSKLGRRKKPQLTRGGTHDRVNHRRLCKLLEDYVYMFNILQYKFHVCVCVSVRVFAWFACSPSRYVSVEDLMSLSSDVLHGFTKFWGYVWVCLWVSLLQTSRFCWWSMSHDFPCLSHNTISWYIMHFREKSLQVLQPLWMATHNGFRQTLLMDGGIRCLWPVHDRASSQSWAPVFG